jgi:prepilin-type processing-associated H-X9-DG protein
MPYKYQCPYADIFVKRDKESKEKWTTTMTAYQVVIGTDTLFPGSECRTLDHITRKKSETIMVVESTAGVCWMAPLDLPMEALEHGVVPAKSGILGIGSYHDGGANVGMADGRVEFIVNSKSPEDVRVLQEQLRIVENMAE